METQSKFMAQATWSASSTRVLIFIKSPATPLGGKYKQLGKLTAPSCRISLREL
jgi:hypothetical protein